MLGRLAYICWLREVCFEAGRYRAISSYGYRGTKSMTTWSDSIGSPPSVNSGLSRMSCRSQQTPHPYPKLKP